MSPLKFHYPYHTPYLNCHNSSEGLSPQPFAAPVRLILCRHGLSEGNASGYLQGSMDSSLSEEGHRQAEKLSLALAGEAFDSAYASDLQRARETAATVLRRHPGLQLKEDSRLCEISSGDMEGLHFEILEERYAKELKILREQMPDFITPGGESTRDCFERALDFFAETLPREAGHTVLLVSHGFLLATMINYFLGRPYEQMVHDIFGNCSISEIICRSLTDFDVLRLNDQSHLV